MFLTAIGVVPSELEFNERPTITSRLTESPHFNSENDFRSEVEKEKMIEFLAGHEIQAGDRTRRVILMTYDDQGYRKWIDKILDAYELFGGKASFFFTGDCLLIYAEQIQRIVAGGHVFGSHGLVHEPHTAMRSDVIRAHLEEWLEMAEQIVPGYQVKFFRFPFGDRNDRVRRVIAEFGLQNVHWNVESGGLDKGTCDRVLKKVSNGSIVLSHMCRYYDVDQAEEILENLIEEGYTLESLETGVDPSDIYSPNSPSSQPNSPDLLSLYLKLLQRSL